MDPVDEIRNRLSLADFIAESVTLKKAGRNFKGLCPFHNEKTPSFIVSPDRQIWHCFGCSKGGDAFTFLMELDRIEFPEALKILAQRTGVKLESKPQYSGKGKLRERLLELHHLASEYYHYLLTQHKIGERARLYLKERGMTDALIKTFGLGFAPVSWDNLTRFLSKKGFTQQEIEMSGVGIKGKGGLYDRFRGRVMFPLKNYRGEIIAFAGRVLDKNAKEAKYVNSPETPLYIKGETLYALDITRDAIRKSQTAVVVEGEFDAISSFQAGVTNVVAIKGTALTEMQVNILKRFSEKLILSLDRDSAGDAAARRGIEIADKAGMEVRVVSTLSGKDPDEAARENANLWKEAVKKAVPFYDFLIDSAIARFGTDEAFSKKKITDEVLPQISRITNTIIQAHYIKLISQKLGIPEVKVEEALRKSKLPVEIAPQIASTITKPYSELLEEHLLACLLQQANVSEALNEITAQVDPSDFTSPVIKKIFISLLDLVNETASFDINLAAKSMPAELKLVFDRATLTDLSAFTDALLLRSELLNTTKLLKKEILRRKLKDLTTQITTAEVKMNETQLLKLQTELKEITNALKNLS